MPRHFLIASYFLSDMIYITCPWIYDLQGVCKIMETIVKDTH